MPETFKFDKKSLIQIKIAFLVFVAFDIFCLVMPYLPDAKHPNGNLPTKLFISVIGIVVFTSFAWVAFRTIKSKELMSVDVDSDGLWPSRLSKQTSLVPWSSINHIKLSNFPQRLVLLDQKDKIIIQIAYQLSGFERLRSLIAENSSFHLPNIPFVIAQNLKSALVLSGFALLQFTLGLVLYLADFHIVSIFFFIFAAFFIFILLAGLKNKTIIDKDHILIQRKNNLSIYPYSEIESVQLKDSFIGDNRSFSVYITFNSPLKNPLQLVSTEINSIELQRLILNLKNASLKTVATE